jgi:hypothetical protein
MNVKQNIGIMNALIRITVGLTMLSWATAKLVKRPWRNSYLFIAFLAAMKVGEGIVKYCPMTDVIQSQMMGSDRNSNENGSVSQNKSDLKQMMDMFVPKQKEQSSNGTNDNQHQQGSHLHEQENTRS